MIIDTAILLVALAGVYVGLLVLYFIPQCLFNRRMVRACRSTVCSHAHCGFYVERYGGTEDRCFWGSITARNFENKDASKCGMSIIRAGTDMGRHLDLRMSLETRNRHLFYTFVVATIAVFSLGFQLSRSGKESAHESSDPTPTTIERQVETDPMEGIVEARVELDKQRNLTCGGER